MSVFELGGFAEYPEDIDGDFNAFNFCLTDKYLAAFTAEDFEAIGKIDRDHLENIIYWINYNGIIGKDNIKTINSLRNGTLITCKNRAIIDAIFETKNVDLVETYLLFGIMIQSFF